MSEKIISRSGYIYIYNIQSLVIELMQRRSITSTVSTRTFTILFSDRSDLPMDIKEPHGNLLTTNLFSFFADLLRYEYILKNKRL